jgi:hypothetical protein
MDNVLQFTFNNCQLENMLQNKLNGERKWLWIFKCVLEQWDLTFSLEFLYLKIFNF